MIGRQSAVLVFLAAAAALVPWAPVRYAALAVLLCYLPGRVVSELCGLRTEDGGRAARTLRAIGLSLGLSPLLLDALWRVTHQWVWMAAGVAGVLIVLSLLPRPHSASAVTSGVQAAEERTPARVRGVLVVLSGWLALCLVLTYWPASRGGDPIAANPHDYVKHQAVLASLAARPLPLGNVFCAEAAEGPYYYYHYFYLIPATLRLATQGVVSIAAAFALQAAMTALVCVGLVYVHARRLAGSAGAAALAVALTALVGGADVLGLLWRGRLVVTLDAWADQPFRLNNFYTDFSWCPQHVQGLVIVLTGAWLLGAQPRRRVCLALGPVMLAALVGTSVYLAAGVALGLAAYALCDVCAKGLTPRERARRLGAYAIVAGSALLLTCPQLHGYLEMSRRYGESLTAEWPRNSAALPGRLLPAGPLANLLDLPWMLLLEYGARGVALLCAGLAAYRTLWRDAGGRLLLLCAGAGLLLFATLRSGVHRYDYGFKIALYPLMALSAMLAAAMVEARVESAQWINPLGWRFAERYRTGARRAVPVAFVVLAIAGLPMGLYEAPGNALRRFVEPGEIWRAERGAYRYLREELPREAVVQSDPGTARVKLVQMAERQWGVLDPADSDVGVFRAADAERVERALADVREAAATDAAARARALLAAHGITHVFVGQVEQERWTALEKFDDTAYFERVYGDDAARVYRLRSEDELRAPGAAGVRAEAN